MMEAARYIVLSAVESARWLFAQMSITSVEKTAKTCMHLWHHYGPQPSNLPRNSIHYPSQQVDGRGGIIAKSNGQTSKQLALVRICAMCVTRMDLYAPCSRNHLKKIMSSGDISRRGKYRK